MKGVKKMALGKQYIEAVRARLGQICTEQMEGIRRASQMAADTIAAGGTCYHHPQGHMIPDETRPERAGHPQFFVHTSVSAEEVAKMRSGDFLFMGSATGPSSSIVDQAIEARKKGVKLVCMASRTEESLLGDPGSQRIFDAADVVIHTYVPCEDGILEMEGVDVKFCPISGVTNSTTYWALCAAITECLLERGVSVSVYEPE